MSKPPSRLRRAAREVQVGLSLGVLAVVLHAVITGTLLLNWRPPAITSPALREILIALAGRGDLLLIGPALSAGAVLALSIEPITAVIGIIGLVEVTTLFMHWAQGGFDDEESPLSYLAPFLVVSAIAAVLTWLGGDWGRRRALRQEAAKPAPLAPGSPAESQDFAEQMRAAQQRAQVGVAAAPTAEAAPPPTPATASSPEVASAPPGPAEPKT